MAPQDDLTAERAAYALDAMCVDVPPRGAREWNQECILAAMKWARQETLREAARVINERADFIARDYEVQPLGDIEWYSRNFVGRVAEDFIEQLDRLAGEGG